MAQSYSITAILSAVDRGFSSAMDKAAKSTESLGKTVQDKMGGIGKAMTYAGALNTHLTKPQSLRVVLLKTLMD